MKGIILAGGAGTRLHPLTQVVSKQLMPVYNKPMIYYPLSIQMLAGIREVLIISTPQDIEQYERLFGDGSQLGMNFSYAVQPSPDGIAQAFLIGEEFLDKSPACLVLGDNIFYSHGLTETLRECARLQDGAIVFAYKVKDPERFGVVEFDANGLAISLEEKPKQPKSAYAVPGIYFYGTDVVSRVKAIKPSPRGELEITDLNKQYLADGKLRVAALGRGAVWMDAGTHQSLREATNFIYAIEEHQQFKIACIEEIALRNGWIDETQLMKLIKVMGKSEYARYLRELID